MEIVIERCAALDVHKDTVVACVRVPDPPAGRQQVIETFRTTTPGLLALRDWHRRAERLDHLLPPRRRIRHAHTRDDGVLMDVQCCTSLDHDLHTSPPAVRRSLIPWSLRFVLAATVSDARGSRVLLRHGLGGTKPARRHRTTAGIFIRLGWALKEPMHYFASRGTAVARGTVSGRAHPPRKTISP